MCACFRNRLFACSGSLRHVWWQPPAARARACRARRRGAHQRGLHWTAAASEFGCRRTAAHEPRVSKLGARTRPRPRQHSAPQQARRRRAFKLGGAAGPFTRGGSFGGPSDHGRQRLRRRGQPQRHGRARGPVTAAAGVGRRRNKPAALFGGMACTGRAPPAAGRARQIGGGLSPRAAGERPWPGGAWRAAAPSRRRRRFETAAGDAAQRVTF